MKLIGKDHIRKTYGGYRLKLQGILSLCLGAAVLATQAQTVVTLKQGEANAFSGGNPYMGTSDTFLWASGANDNYGASTSLNVGQNTNGEDPRLFTGLLRFDVTSLAPIVNDIQFVTLMLWGGPNYGPTQEFRDVQIGIFPLAVANAGWIEGEGNNTPAADGEPTWFNKAAPSTAWAGGGNGARVAGVDYVDTAIATLNFNTGDASQFHEFNIPVALVQDWINNPSNNAGLDFVLLSTNALASEAAWMEFSSSNDSADNRPQLIITYNTVPEPATLGMVFLGAGAAIFMTRARRRTGPWFRLYKE